MSTEFKPNTTYTLYIVAPPEKVWQALTEGEMTKQYFFGRRIESEWKVGGPAKYWQPDGTLDVSGTIVECDRPKRLSYTWCVEWVPELKKLPDCLVTFQIDDLGGASRLIMSEAHQWAIPDKLLEGGRRGWPFILCG
ncbi:MAG TPA: SRPBCC family protein, partial [Pirellulales bacterium]